MTGLRDVYAEYGLPPAGSALEYAKAVQQKALRAAVRDHRDGIVNGFSIQGVTLRTINGLFDGTTTEEDEDQALVALLACTHARDLVPVVNTLTWDNLDDELDESDLTQILGHLTALLDHRDYRIAFWLRWFFLVEPAVFANRPMQQLKGFASASPASIRATLADRVLAERDRVLDGLALMSLRGQATYVTEFRTVIDLIAGAYRPSELIPLSWELFYTERIGSQLERGECRLLLETLPDLVNAQFAQPRRVALYDMLRRWDRHLAALEQLVAAVGSERQRADMRRFTETRRVFMDNFPVQQPGAPPAIQEALQSILSALTGAGGVFQDLVAAVQRLSTSITDLNVPQLLNTEEDDAAVAAVNSLSQQQTLAFLPTDYKSELIRAMMTGAAEDEEEQAVITLLRETKARSTAEFAQLAGAATWEALDSNFNGTEYNELEALFVF